MESLAQELALRHSSHPCGAPTLSVGTIHGGMGVNLVPDRVVVEIDRRLVPGEDPLIARQEVIDYISEHCSTAVIEHEEPFLASEGLSNEGVGAAKPQRAFEMLQKKLAFLLLKKLPVMGPTRAFMQRLIYLVLSLVPGSIAQAHTANEWIDLREVEQATEILKNLVGYSGSA